MKILYFHFLLSSIAKKNSNLVNFLYVVFKFCLKNKLSIIFYFDSFLQL